MKDKIKEKITNLLRLKEEIIFAYLYGSYLDDSLFNDIDVAIFLDKDRMPKDLFSYADKISTELSDRTKVLVDVRVINSAPVGFLHSVFLGRLLFTKDENLLTSLIEKNSLEYIDFYDLSLQSLKDLCYD